MNIKTIILSIAFTFVCICMHAQALYSYRNTKKVNKATSEEVLAKNQMEYVCFTVDRTACYFSDIDGNNIAEGRSFTYQGERNGMYTFFYQDPNDANSSWSIAFSKDYKKMQSTSSNNPFIKIYELLEMIRN